jgi:hypothetical protein
MKGFSHVKSKRRQVQNRCGRLRICLGAYMVICPPLLGSDGAPNLVRAGFTLKMLVSVLSHGIPIPSATVAQRSAWNTTRAWQRLIAVLLGGVGPIYTVRYSSGAPKEYRRIKECLPSRSVDQRERAEMQLHSSPSAMRRNPGPPAASAVPFVPQEGLD